MGVYKHTNHNHNMFTQNVNMICSLNKSTLPHDGQTTVDPNDDHHLLPGLPNHIAQTILSSVPPSLLSAVCRRWRHHIYTHHHPPFLSLYVTVANNNNNSNSNSNNNNIINARSSHPLNSIEFFTFDPISGKWATLPPPATELPLRLLRRHPSFISRTLAVQSVAVAGCLVVVAATGENFLPALSRPLVFDPLGGDWCLGPPMTSPRRWCAAGCYRDSLYVASGVGAHYRGEVARMVEKWEVKRSGDCNNKLSDLRDEWRWDPVAGLRDGRFSREAVEAVGYKGKICMVNMKGNTAGKEGAVYNIEKNQWEKMPTGMVAGWTGPVAVAAEANEVMYVVDEDNGGVKKYDDESDCWHVVVEGSELLKGAAHMGAGGGKICVVAGGGGRIMVVDVVAQPVRMWVVDPPLPESEVISVHILRRPCNRL